MSENDNLILPDILPDKASRAQQAGWYRILLDPKSKSAVRSNVLHTNGRVQTSGLGAFMGHVAKKLRSSQLFCRHDDINSIDIAVSAE